MKKMKNTRKYPQEWDQNGGEVRCAVHFLPQTHTHTQNLHVEQLAQNTY